MTREITPFIIVPIIACPTCGASDYKTNRTNQNGDNTVSRHAVCRACGEPFDIILEWPREIENLPNFGRTKKRRDKVRAHDRR